jgi:hypothetical protein
MKIRHRTAHTVNIETWAEYAAKQPVLTRWDKHVLEHQLAGNEQGLVEVAREVTPFGTYVLSVQAVDQ